MPRIKVPRISLRMLLLVTIVLGSGTGYYVHRAQSQYRATQWILNNGGAVYYDYEIDLSKLTQEDVGGDGWVPPPWQREEYQPPGFKILRDILGIDYFATVAGVYVSSTEGPVRDLSQLKSLPNLRLVTIGRLSSDECDFSAISSLTKLQRLEISFFPLDDLSFLQSAHELKVLELWYTDIKDIQSISNLSNLERISISSQIESTAPLAGLTSLKSITINTSDFDIGDFRNLRQLEYLELDVLNCRYSETQLREFDQILPTTYISIRSNEELDFESRYEFDATPAG